jgi:hypothetical protein
VRRIAAGKHYRRRLGSRSGTGAGSQSATQAHGCKPPPSITHGTQPVGLMIHNLKFQNSDLKCEISDVKFDI